LQRVDPGAHGWRRAAGSGNRAQDVDQRSLASQAAVEVSESSRKLRAGFAAKSLSTCTTLLAQLKEMQAPGTAGRHRAGNHRGAGDNCLVSRKPKHGPAQHLRRRAPLTLSLNADAPDSELHAALSRCKIMGCRCTELRPAISRDRRTSRAAMCGISSASAVAAVLGRPFGFSTGDAGGRCPRLVAPDLASDERGEPRPGHPACQRAGTACSQSE